MPKYDLIVPSGEVILLDPATGRRLRLSSESGPLTLGSVTLDFEFLAPHSLSRESESEPSSPEARSGRAETSAENASAGRDGEVLEALARMQSLPPGASLPGSKDEASPSPAAVEPPCRVLDAPLEALTRDEFEQTLAGLVHARDESERETEFLKEIEADPEDIRELEARTDAVDMRLSAVSKRFSLWEALQRKADEAFGSEAPSKA